MEGAAAVEGAAAPQSLGELPTAVWLLAAPACGKSGKSGEGGEGGEGGEARMLAVCEGSPLLERGAERGGERGSERGCKGEGGEGGEGGEDDEAAQALAPLCVFEAPCYSLLTTCYLLLTTYYLLLTTLPLPGALRRPAL